MSIATRDLYRLFFPCGELTRIFQKSVNINNSQFAPLKHPLFTKTPFQIQLGALDILHDEGIAFAEAVRKEGNEVEIHVEPFSNHNNSYVGHLTGFSAEAEKVVQLAKAFLSVECKKQRFGKLCGEFHRSDGVS